MPELIQWPPTLVAKATNLRVRPATRSAGEAINGFEQVGSALSAKWVMELQFNNLKADRILAYRAILAAMNGRENWLRFPIHDGQLAADFAPGGLAAVPHSDDTFLSDGSGYRVRDVAGVLVSGVLGSKSLTVDLSRYGRAFQGGQYFGAGEDLHIAKSVIYDAAGVATVRFEPSLRRDHVGSTFRLRPYLICRAASDDTGDHSLEWGRATAPQLQLVEVPQHGLVS